MKMFTFTQMILESDSSTARVLLLMGIPGHFVFILLIWQFTADHIQLSYPFVTLYLIAALIQVDCLSL